MRGPKYQCDNFQSFRRGYRWLASNSLNVIANKKSGKKNRPRSRFSESICDFRVCTDNSGKIIFSFLVRHHCNCDTHPILGKGGQNEKKSPKNFESGFEIIYYSRIRHNVSNKTEHVRSYGRYVSQLKINTERAKEPGGKLEKLLNFLKTSSLFVRRGETFDSA